MRPNAIIRNSKKTNYAKLFSGGVSPEKFQTMEQKSYTKSSGIFLTNLRGVNMDLQKEISHLEKSLSLQGELVEEDENSITIQITNSLLQIPKDFVQNMSNIETNDKSRMIVVSLTKDAKIIQKTLVTPEEALACTITANIFNRGQSFSRGALIDDCTECSRCTDCTECSRCLECSRCTQFSHFTERSRFTNSIDCSRCTVCSQCLECTECSRCIDCSRCIECTECSRCLESSRCTQYIDSIDLQIFVKNSSGQRFRTYLRNR